MKRLLRTLTLAIVCSGLALWSACDSATPTAPSGTILTISANPTQIPLDGASTITVVGREPNGNLLREGTEIFFSTDIGQLTEVIVAVDDNGRAQTRLRGDGRVGTANVEARVSTSSPGGEGSAPSGTGAVEVVIGSPTVPSGTTLTINSDDSQIALNGSTIITVIGRRPDGNPLNAGTEVFFSTNLGSVTPAAAQTDSAGVAKTTLRGDGRVGTATVEARVNTVADEGGGAATATIDVQIGSTVSAVSLQATPTTVPETFDGTVRRIQLLALVRDDQGQPLPGVAVNFASEVGSLDSGGGFITTNANGEARDSLVVTEGDLNSVAGNSFTVTVEAASGEGGIQTDTVEIGILRRPRADFVFTSNRLTVSFEDRSTGNPTSWQWDFGDGQTGDGPNPTHTYSEPGQYTVVLTVSNSAGDDSTSRVVTVSSSN